MHMFTHGPHAQRALPLFFSLNERMRLGRGFELVLCSLSEAAEAGLPRGRPTDRAKMLPSNSAHVASAWRPAEEIPTMVSFILFIYRCLILSFPCIQILHFLMYTCLSVHLLYRDALVRSHVFTLSPSSHD